MIQLNLILHNLRRLPFYKKTLQALSKIKKDNKSKIFLNVLSSFKEEKYPDIISNSGIRSRTVFFDESATNYMNKIHYATSVCDDSEYMCSIDDDVYISSQLWDYFIENINFLDDNPDTLLLSPILSNGIPSTEFFLEDLFEEHHKKYIYNIFLNTHIPNIWGADYSSLNKTRHTWDETFYNDVCKIDHHFKGIHPVRVSKLAQSEICNIFCEHYIDKFLKTNNFRIEKHNRPYFCNNLFFTKTEHWKNVVNDISLFVDFYDEVPYNKYKDRHNLNFGFVRNGLGIHPAYNNIDGSADIDKEYINKFLNII
jgi:hypothetical protein